ncbi:MAG: metal ABC transporter permease [Deltaproteobacteria bacterium]|nr:metal ABC transporter permease [Deltaproteobacteria bacterium]
MEIFEFEFMQRAFLAGALVGTACSLIGVFVVLRGLAFIGAGISHSALAGVAIGLLAGVPPLLASLIFCSLIAVLLGAVSRVGKVREDTAIGIFFAATMALGIFLLSFAESRSVDLLSYLFGSILTISYEELLYSLVLTAVVAGVVYLFYKELIAVIFDEELAQLSGVPARFISYMLLVLVSIAVIASIKLVGIVLVSALIVTPAATALQLSRSFNRVVALSVLLGVLQTELGLILAYYFDCPPGATIVLLSTTVFLASTAGKAALSRP